ncbi:hypothetical protein QBC32DRAFT_225718 [Pseudoneurospora amorphoporcata]|uniref:Uncharacterized protein n=1 Tax=Pseudoneurospora amorphoporcata TaxID=241081 RepID=A0AAN6SA41_9PEZI|nr:hypothetical protein QBC32DRAFT_225718 [Pseudoneurospora amorphoporcata]
MHPSELLYRDRALFTFTERPPHSTKQSRWYCGVSYHPSDGHSPDLHNPFHPEHQWIIYEYIPVTDQTFQSQPAQPAQPPTSFAVFIYQAFLDPNIPDPGTRRLRVLPDWSGVTTQIIRDNWQASFHLLCHIGDEMWIWIRDKLIDDFLTGRSIEAEDGVVKDGQDFVKIVLAEWMRDDEIISDGEWWEGEHFYYKSFREVEGFEVSGDEGGRVLVMRLGRGVVRGL